jgi:DNA-binding NtrC family response regulator
MCDEGLFRKDLYFRLNVFPIEIPPLRERKEDIPHLAGIFLERLNAFHLKDIKDIHPAVMEGFDNYSWPGNIRELENLIERAYILETSSILTPESFPPEIFVPGEHQPRMKMDTSSTLKDVRQEGVEQIERIYLKELLTENKGRIKTSAEVAGISTRQLSKLMKKYGLRKEEFKST